MQRSWPVFAAFLSVGVLGSSGSAQAGLFDFLFGAPRPAPAPYGYAPQPPDFQNRKALRNRDDAKSRRGAEHLSATSDKPSPLPARDLAASRKLAEVARDEGFQAAFMQDPTLRSGDILVTQTGIVVFEGGDAKRISNFRPLSTSRLRNRADLALLQKISGFGQPRLALPAADAMPPLVIQQRGKRSAKAPATVLPRGERANPREAAITQ